VTRQRRRWQFTIAAQQIDVETWRCGNTIGTRHFNIIVIVIIVIIIVVVVVDVVRGMKTTGRRCKRQRL
jgi:hypothetical protein